MVPVSPFLQLAMELFTQENSVRVSHVFSACFVEVAELMSSFQIMSLTFGKYFVWDLNLESLIEKLTCNRKGRVPCSQAHTRS